MSPLTTILATTTILTMLATPFNMKAHIAYGEYDLKGVSVNYTNIGRTQTPLDDESSSLGSSSSIREAVIESFGTSSPMVDVARCESTFRQYNSEGEVLRGRVNSDDVGVLQINEKYHLEKSIELGYDIYTVDGNIKMAKYLYDHQGLKPWVWSKDCWSGVGSK